MQWWNKAKWLALVVFRFWSLSLLTLLWTHTALQMQRGCGSCLHIQQPCIIFTSAVPMQFNRLSGAQSKLHTFCAAAAADWGERSVSGNCRSTQLASAWKGAGWVTGKVRHVENCCEMRGKACEVSDRVKMYCYLTERRERWETEKQ